MSTSPAAPTSPTEQETLSLTPKEFKAKLDELVKHHNNIMKLAAKVYSLGKTQRLQYPNGQQIGRKELRTLSSQLGKEIKLLGKNYSAFGKRRKRKKREGGSAGFKNHVILVTDTMRDFFSQANLGPSQIGNPQSAPLNEVLSIGSSGITTRAIMTALFSIYAHVNQMASDPTNGAFLTATERMNQYFQDTYARLAAQPQRYYKNRETGEPDYSQPIPIFDPNHFFWNRLQSIIADNTRPMKADAWQTDHLPLVTAEEKAVLDGENTKQRLAYEQSLVTEIGKTYKLQREEQRAANKAAAASQ